MSSELVSLRDARERTIATLNDLFTHDELDIDEFDRRISLAHDAASLAEIEALVADFPTRGAALAAAPGGAASPTVALVPASEADRTLRLTAIFGGAVREGAWTCPRRLRVVTVMGGALLDFREARLAAGVTEVRVTSVVGGVQVIVPPGLAVEVEGTAILGGFDHADRSSPEGDPDRPSLRIRGVAVMGGVHVETRLPGEGEREAEERREMGREMGRERGREMGREGGRDEIEGKGRGRRRELSAPK